MTMVRTSDRPASRSDVTAVALAAAGLAAAPFAWYVAAVLSVLAGIVLGVTVGLRHHPLSRWTRAGIWLAGAGLLLELVMLLAFTPLSVTSTTSG